MGSYVSSRYCLFGAALEDLSSVVSGSQKDISSVPPSLEMLSPLSTATSGVDDGPHDYDLDSAVELTHDRYTYCMPFNGILILMVF